MTIEEARIVLNVLEGIRKNPETILTNFPDTDAEFLFSIDFDGVPLSRFVKNQLEQQTLFCGCSISEEHGKGAFAFSVNIPSLDYKRLHRQPEAIVRLFPRKKEFILLHKAEEYYQKEMNQTIAFQPHPVSDREKRFQDLSLKGRMKNLGKEWKREKSVWVKISDTYYWLVDVPFHKDRCRQAMEKTRKERTDANEYLSKLYQEALSRQEYYQCFAPDYLKDLKKKQAEIREYLLANGYRQIKES